MGFDVYRLSNITLIFLPATTSIVQPLDQASFAFKAHSRAAGAVRDLDSTDARSTPTKQ
jgi:hypothetical protein